ncbi:ATPase/histidine kinase/DNA gyrase B/HSP90 domain protein [Paenibacillus sp. oral taxon 786 str. D14]|uniref:sensor histidine kinase n=1 Tax=Paenibacillus sp. oral taxon 786 TaxID=652715 RepID=UPI0001AFD507|nr:sensor histidine kinase [Paenibacillus sp. oral taxon 786]EES72402.1 ATPase/histidine kinase/DNA gyrase B/HSP90 domain protein [Paenibacillus sp. oral taxon 786 str. D14]
MRLPNLQKYLIKSNYKLLALILLIVLLPIITLGTYSYKTSQQAVYDRNLLDMQRSLDLISEGVAYRMKEVEFIADFIVYDETLQSYMKMEKDGYTNYEFLNKYLHPKLYNATLNKQMNLQIQLYVGEGMLPEVYDGHGPDLDPLRLGKTYQIYSTDKLEGSDLQLYYPRDMVVDITRSTRWEQIDNDKIFNNISYVVPLVDLVNLRAIGMVRIVAHVEDIFRLERDDSNIAGYVVLNQNREIVNSMDNGKAGLTWSALAQEDVVTLFHEIKGMEWKLAEYVPRAVLSEKIGSLKAATIWICLISFIVLFFLAYLVTLTLSKKVHRILKLVRSFQDGDFSRKIAVEGRDEFSDISAALNSMGSHVDQLIQDLYISKLEVKDAELRTLQAQINPHFLYNTLSAIQTLASMNETDRLKQMVSGLARFYRLTLNDGKFMISVEKELAQVKEYLQIQQIRHEHLLNYKMIIDPQVNEYTTIKLILQPFVENCIEHAWREDGHDLYVEVEALQVKEEIHFYIRDNGRGIEPHVMEDIFNPNNEKVGYGIINVSERIRLQYGASYGVHISCRPGKGTCVWIRIPAVQS